MNNSYRPDSTPSNKLENLYDYVYSELNSAISTIVFFLYIVFVHQMEQPVESGAVQNWLALRKLRQVSVESIVTSH